MPKNSYIVRCVFVVAGTCLPFAAQKRLLGYIQRHIGKAGSLQRTCQRTTEDRPLHYSAFRRHAPYMFMLLCTYSYINLSYRPPFISSQETRKQVTCVPRDYFVFSENIYLTVTNNVISSEQRMTIRETHPLLDWYSDLKG